MNQCEQRQGCPPAGQAGAISRISVSELRQGMRVVDAGVSWINHPYLFSKDMQITSVEQIEAIRKKGYRELFVRVAESRTASAPDDDLVQPRLPGTEALAQADALYAESFEQVKRFIDDAKLGRPINRAASQDILEGMLESVVKNPDALASIVNLRAYNQYTFTHCINVAAISIIFGQYLGLKRDRLQQLGEAGLFHDLGKICVPEDILNKPAPLTAAEFHLVKFHPRAGVDILKGQEGFSAEVLTTIDAHHEKYNGSGYARGLTGDKLALTAQIVGLADTYDALTSNRCYRQGILPNSAMRILFALRDKDFSEDLVDRFIKCLGIYPVGSLVRLKNGKTAMVCGSNTASPLLPVVKVVADGAGRLCPPTIVDLSSARAKADGGMAITGSADPRDLGLTPRRYLF